MKDQREASGSRGLRSWPGQRGQSMKFVLLRHLPNTRAPHFDLLLELRSGQRLWALETSQDPRVLRSTIKWKTHGLHHRRYLWFEGDIGAGRGIIKQIESGNYIVRQINGRIDIELTGRTWSGAFHIWRDGRGQHLWIGESQRLPLAS